jgi:hypothetical protein
MTPSHPHKQMNNCLAQLDNNKHLSPKQDKLFTIFDFQTFPEPFGLTSVKLKLNLKDDDAKRIIVEALTMKVIKYDTNKSWLLSRIESARKI